MFHFFLNIAITFRKLPMEILDFISFAFSKIARKLCESSYLNLFLAFGGCKEWLNGSVGSSSVVDKYLFLFLNKVMCWPYLPT